MDFQWNDCRAWFAGAALLLASGAGAFAEDRRAVDDISGFTLADGFEIQLFAADPAIAKPIQMNFDAKGRLWVVSSQSYPQLKPGAEPEDKVYILEDTDGDGKSNRSTVFADGLMIPTGIELGGGGAYVGNGTELLHLVDTDGDDKADKSTVLLSGFGTEDTHHLIHTFRWGPGGILHFAQAVYIHSHVETPWGVRRLNGGGYWLYRPESAWLEVFVRGMTNTWGIAFDAYGQAFGVDNDNTSVYYFAPGASLIRTPGESMFLPALVNNKPKYCGAEFVSGSHFPEEWQENFVTCDFRAHRVCRYRMTESGAGYAAEELAPLVTSLDPEFRPIDLKMGPDGALYVCDWFNPIINHGEVDFRDPRRDKTHGRIWRIVAKDRPLVPRPALVDAPLEKLLEAQTSPEGWTRHFATRVLAERPRSEVVGALETWTSRQTDELALLRALWIYQTLDLPNSPLLEKLCNASDGRVRAAAVRVLSYWMDRIANAPELLADRVADEHPRVRLEAIRALAKQPGSTGQILTILDQPLDPFLEYSLKLTLRETQGDWLPNVATKVTDETSARRWVYALLALDSPAAAQPLRELWKSGKIADADHDNVVAAIAKHGAPEDLGAIVEVLSDSKASTAERHLRLAEALLEAQRLRGIRPQGDLGDSLSGLLGSDDPKIRLAAIRLAGAWQAEAVRPTLTRLVENQETTSELRLAAMETLAKLPGAKEFLVKSITELADPKARMKALQLLVALDVGQASELAVAALIQEDKPEAATAIYDSFLKQSGGAEVLAQRLQGKTLPKPIAEEGLRVINANALLAPELTKAIIQAGSLPEMERTYTPEQIATLASQVTKSGDAARGEEIYRREKLNCVKCHKVRGTGGEVGPDLSGIGASAPVDYLVESLLLPNKKVKENYHSMIVSTVDGAIVTGVPVRQTEEEIVLRNAENKLVSVATRDVEESKIGGSIMPVGLVEPLSSQELLDLVRYLSELGKPGPYGPSREILAKEWRLLGPMTPAEGEKLQPSFIKAGAKLIEQTGTWQKSLVLNAGWVYLREFALKPELPIVFASCSLITEQGGKVRLAFEPGRHAELWLDGQPLTSTQIVGNDAWYEVELQPGKHSLLAKIDVSNSPHFLKLRVFPLDDTMELELLASAAIETP